MSHIAAAAAVVSVLVLAGFVSVLDAGLSRPMTPPFALLASDVAMPPARVGHAMAYDAESDRIVLFGGEAGYLGSSTADTWAYDVRSNAWQNMHPSVLPPPRLGPGMTYDSKADLVILFGGNAASHTYVLNDTWTYDLNENTWTEMTPQVSPPARLGTQAVYDPQLDKVILFGGVTAYEKSAFNDTWTYDLASNTWTQVAPAASPSRRGMPIMAYDTESDRAVLFSGSVSGTAAGADNQTWAYDARSETWAQMSPRTSPALRLNAAGAYDARADRFLVFGGETGWIPLAFDNDTWAYDLNANAWTSIDSASAPADRVTAMAYDAKCDRTVLFGGTGDPYRAPYYQDTWIFDYGNRTWTMVLPDTVNPTVTISSPTDGATLAATSATVTGTASDNLGVAKVEVGLDNATWTVATGTTSWSATLSLAEGPNTIYVRVTDTSGNTAMIAIDVTVATSPVWLWPAVGVGVAGAALAAYGFVRRRRKRAAETRPPT